MKNSIAIYGGWHVADILGRAVRLVTRCTAPRMDLYLANFNARRVAR